MDIDKIGPIEVLSALGQGAKSNVVLVRRAADGREYALKITNVAKRKERKYLAQARQEFRVARMLDHPNIVKAFAIETEIDWLLRPTRVKVLLEYVPGQTLDRIAAPGLGTLLHVFEQAADAVAYMHEHGVLHADLKPTNIMLGTDVVKVIDFGLSRMAGEDPGRLQGTPEYMAPETVSRKVVDERTDIFNFGAMMYRLLTGLYPPQSAGTFPMTDRAYRERYRPAHDANGAIPDSLGRLVDVCLAYAPEARPASMDEVCRTLNQIVDEGDA